MFAKALRLWESVTIRCPIVPPEKRQLRITGISLEMVWSCQPCEKTPEENIRKRFLKSSNGIQWLLALDSPFFSHVEPQHTTEAKAICTAAVPTMVAVIATSVVDEDWATPVVPQRSAEFGSHKIHKWPSSGRMWQSYTWFSSVEIQEQADKWKYIIDQSILG